ncbi:MAG: EamA family transporter [Candidatus Eremiobacteraeota bacterium]|nr:EamA family transporter [Candidatus Eremiobacteraeota bacterium]
MPYLRLLGAQLAIGAAAIFARYALQGAGPLAVSALRLGIAALIAIVVARGFARLSPRRETAFIFAGLALALHFATWLASLQYTSIAVSTVLVTTTPIWTEIYDVIG